MKSIFCLISTEPQAQKLVDRLLAEGFSPDDISILFPDPSKKGTRGEEFGYNQRPGQPVKEKGGLGTEKHTKAPEGGVTGAAAGGVIGGSIGLLAGIGALAIPGLGPFIAAGPLLATLSGSAIGGSLGLIIGALIGAGMPEYEAKKYEAGLRAGNILVCVHTVNAEQVNRASNIMKKEGAQDIATSREKTTSSR